VPPLLELRNVTRRFGGVVALDDVSLEVAEGEIAGLIGPNGAGKTTAFNVITRLYRPDEGDVVFAGESLLSTPTHGVVRRGIARTFQNTEVFPSLTVLENALLGAHSRAGLFSERRLRAEAFEALEYVELEDVAARAAAGLSYAQLKRLEIARALMARPKLLLLDEPAGGLSHEEVDRLAGFIMRMRDGFELTILLVEHHMNLVMRISDSVSVLDFGRKIAGGTPSAVQSDAAVIEAYLGTDE
jgi:branched-chain amino acid transport system ATP-binding protein